MITTSIFSDIKVLVVTFIIFLLLNLIIKQLPPIWILLTIELIFFQFIILFLIESINLSEIYGYLISYALIVSVALESAVLLGIILILNKLLN